MHEMMDDEDKRGGAVIYDGRCFGLTKDSERPFEISATVAPISGLQLELYIIIGGSDLPEHFARSLRKRRAPEVGVDNNAGAVDYRLDPAGAEIVKRLTDKIDNLGELRDFLAS